MYPRTRLLFSTLFLLILLFGIPTGMTWRNAQQEKLNRALVAAVAKNDTSTVVALLAQGANANTLDVPLDIRPFWRQIWDRMHGRRVPEGKFSTVLLRAFYWRPNASGAITIRPPQNLALVKALVQSGANVNVSDSYSQTPLLMATTEGRRSMVHFLIEHGADVHAKDASGNSALCLAATWHTRMPDDSAIINALLDRGADINGANLTGMTPLMYAAERHNLKTAQILLNRLADLRRKNNRGETALLLAQRSDDKELLRLLKQAGAQSSRYIGKP